MILFFLHLFPPTTPRQEGKFAFPNFLSHIVGAEVLQLNCRSTWNGRQNATQILLPYFQKGGKISVSSCGKNFLNYSPYSFGKEPSNVGTFVIRMASHLNNSLKPFEWYTNLQFISTVFKCPPNLFIALKNLFWLLAI